MRNKSAIKQRDDIFPFKVSIHDRASGEIAGEKRQIIEGGTCSYRVLRI